MRYMYIWKIREGYKIGFDIPMKEHATSDTAKETQSDKPELISALWASTLQRLNAEREM